MNELIAVNFDTQTVSARNKKNIKNPKVVYVLLAKDKTVKVGITGNFEKRMCTIQTASGKEIVDYFHTPICSNANEIESKTKKKYKKYNILGEWFNCRFDKMVKFVKREFDANSKIEYWDEKQLDEMKKTFAEFMKSNNLSSVNKEKEFFDSSKLVLFFLFAYSEKLKEFGFETECDNVLEALELIKDGLLQVPEYFNEEQYAYILNIEEICEELIVKNG